MYCVECGNKLSQDAKFCQNCGKPVTLDIENNRTESSSSDKGTPAPDTTKASSRECPQCGRDDRVEKVSAIVASQTREISGGSWQTNTYVDEKGKKHSEDHYTPYSATESSVLAQRLSPPAKPLAEGMSIIAIIGALVLFACGGYLSLTAIVFPLSGELKSADDLPTIIMIGIVGLGIIGGGIAIIVSANKSAKERAIKVAPKIKHWQAAMAQWDKLYYCSRDDGVFNPNERVFVPIDQMMNHLFSDSEQTSS